MNIRLMSSLNSFRSKSNFGVNILLVLTILITIVFWISTIDQPLVDRHDFRQAQTAITSHFLNFSIYGIFHYETPVLGYPWMVPFEFPFYQLLTSLVSKIFNLDLVVTGRSISILFSVLLLFPCRTILRAFKAPSSSYKYFLILYFSSNIYMYWSRTFMIESAALFLCLSTLSFYLRCRSIVYKNLIESAKSSSFSYKFLFENVVRLIPLSFLLTLALLTKATTSLTLIPLILIDNILLIFASKSDIIPPIKKHVVSAIVSVISVSLIALLPMLILKLWVNHADVLKSLGSLSITHTSANLSDWNFGTIQQRLSLELWFKTTLLLVVTPFSLVATFFLIRISGISLTSFALRPVREYLFHYKYLCLLCFYLFLSPLLLFSNLHIVHEYYQYANAVFFLLIVAITFSVCAQKDLFAARSRKRLNFLLVVFILSNYIVFSRIYIAPSYASFGENQDKLNVGHYVQKNTNSDNILFYQGDSWSSAIPFHSLRRAISIDSLLDSSKLKSSDLETLLDRKVIGAIVYKESKLVPDAIFDKCNSRMNPRSFGSFEVVLCNTST